MKRSLALVVTGSLLIASLALSAESKKQGRSNEIPGGAMPAADDLTDSKKESKKDKSLTSDDSAEAKPSPSPSPTAPAKK